MKIKHSKYKNTGILFELLVRQITADTLKGDDSPAIDLLKKYFVKSELGREYKLYESILKSKVINESRATLFINTALDNSKRFNKTSLKKQKYNLINEIKNHYDLDTFFGAKIKNYKEFIKQGWERFGLIMDDDDNLLINSDIISINKETVSNFYNFALFIY